MNDFHSTSSQDEEKKNELAITNTQSHLDVPVLVDGSHIEGGATKLDPNHGYDAMFVKRTIRKVDLRLVPILAALYSVSLIDRTNISLAAVAGMNKELNLTIDNRYSIALLVFFPIYIAAEIPCNMIIRKVSPRLFLSSASMAFGLVMLGMGFVKSHVTLTLCRALLGLFEACIFPGSAFLVSTWYIRREVQVRLTSFYMVSVFISGFSSIWAYGMTQIKTGLTPWRYIFIIMGAVTVAVALLGYVLVVDFPDQAKFLTPEQKEMVNTRIERDRGDSQPDPLTFRKTLRYAMSPKLWAFGLCFGCSTVASYAFSYFLPLILRSFGYSVKDSQLLVAPPYVVAVFLALVLAKWSDMSGRKAPFIVFNAILVIVGLSMVAFLPAGMTKARYAGVFLGIAGCNGNVAFTLGQASCSITGQSKRGYTSALQVMAGGVGGIIASTVFRAQDSPTYRTGIWVCIGAQILILALQGALVTYFLWENRKARNGHHIIENTPGFRYLI